MISTPVAALLLGMGLVAGQPDGAKPAGPADRPDALREYQAVRDHAGRGAEAQVKLALWCEAHGLSAERHKHLALAVLSDPKNTAARGLMGLVACDGHWVSPDRVGARVKADAATAAKLAEYNARRDALPPTAGADAHFRLAQWCEENGLGAEAKAHYVTVTRLDPSRDAAWKRLGLKKQNGRWVSDAQLAAERAEADAQKKADRHWKPLLAKYRAGLHDANPVKRAAAESALARVDDPRAVPTLWATLVQAGDATDQAAAVPVLARLDGPAAGRALAMVAVFGATPDVARAAAETLRLRDSRDFIGLLVDMIRKPLRYEVRQVNGPALPGELFIEGEKADVRRVYDVPDLQLALAQIPPRLFDSSVPFDPFGARTSVLAAAPAMTVTPRPGRAAVTVTNPDNAAARRDQEIAGRLEQIKASIRNAWQQLAADVTSLEAGNAQVGRLNGQVLPVLNAVTGQDFGAAPADWRAWWADQRGYVYDRPETSADKPVISEVVPNLVSASFTPPHNACFAAGTPVRTLDGPKPIETIKVGDQVLAQDPTTGRLFFTPVVAVYHNKPAVTLKVTIDGERAPVEATGIHRFWKAGHGWVMARELKPGDVVRTVGGTGRIASVETGQTQPVFNLEVAEGTSYFVGRSGLLVHDNTTVWPVSHPFDTPPDLAARAE